MRGAGRAVNSEVLYLVVSARFVAIYDLEDATRPFSSPEYELRLGGMSTLLACAAITASGFTA